MEKCAILLIDHDLPFVLNLCERLYVLDAGKVIASGSPVEIQANQRVKEAYLGARGGTSQTGRPAEAPVAPDIATDPRPLVDPEF